MKKSWLLSLGLASLMSGANADEAVINPFNFVSKSSHQVTLLNHGLASFEKRLEMIEKAKKSIEVEYFIYRTDISSKIFTQALVKKAREGVKVRMLLDYFMIKGDITPFHVKALEDEGIEVRYFNDTGTLNLFSGQYRNHRKLLLIDGKEALTGGRNIGNEYFDLDPEYNFLDREIWFEGSVVPSILRTFNETFTSKLSKKAKIEEMPMLYDSKYAIGEGPGIYQYENDLRYWTKKDSDAREFINAPVDDVVYNEIRNKGKEELNQEYSGSCAEMSFHSEYPTIGKSNRKKYRIIKHAIFDRVKATKSALMIDSPYFIVNDELGKSLDVALKNKAKVKVLTNSLNSTDAIYVYAAFDSLATDWLKKGVDSYIYKGDKPETYEMLPNILTEETRFGVHAKTFIFDNKDVIIGTYNVDPRSANFNSEMVVSCDNNPQLAKAVQADIDSRISNSIHLDSPKAIKEAEFYQIGFGKKIVYYFLKVPSNIFSYLL